MVRAGRAAGALKQVGVHAAVSRRRAGAVWRVAQFWAAFWPLFLLTGATSGRQPGAAGGQWPPAPTGPRGGRQIGQIGIGIGVAARRKSADHEPDPSGRRLVAAAPTQQGPLLHQEQSGGNCNCCFWPSALADSCPAALGQSAALVIYGSHTGGQTAHLAPGRRPSNQFAAGRQAGGGQSARRPFAAH